jgi:ribosomal protein S18 acetylase RimI-like enzyme
MTPTLSLVRTVVRPATLADVPGIAEVIRAAYEEHAPVLDARHPGYLTDLGDVESRLATGTVLVAEAGGTLTGTVTLHLDASPEGVARPRHRAVVRALAVDPEARGQGTARALMRSLIAHAMRAGADELCVRTPPFMTAAVALFESLGFEPEAALGGSGAMLAYRLRLTGGRPAARHRLHRINAQAPWPVRRHGDELVSPVWMAGR